MQTNETLHEQQKVMLETNEKYIQEEFRAKRKRRFWICFLIIAGWRWRLGAFIAGACICWLNQGCDLGGACCLQLEFIFFIVYVLCHT